MDNNIKFLSYYLPQYHPIPENDLWWGEGFTEWTNVKKAKPLFRGHNQPIVPGVLGYYDLLKQPEIQEKQAKLAKDYGIDGFIYYQYWFGKGKMLLEKPAEKMLQNKNVDIPFCFCWANETWKGIWHGLDNPNVLIEQTYNGDQDYIEYFNYLLPFFKDDRYIKVNNKPMFNIYRLDDIPELSQFINLFNLLAIKNGFDGIYFVATHGNTEMILSNDKIYGKVGVDIFNEIRYEKKGDIKKNSFFNIIIESYKFRSGNSDTIYLRKRPKIFDYKNVVKKFNNFFPNEKHIPCVFPNWDNSARSGLKSMIFKNTNPILWEIHLLDNYKLLLKNKKNPPFIVIKSWNEWAEGNYIEPDEKFGLSWLEAVLKVKNSKC